MHPEAAEPSLGDVRQSAAHHIGVLNSERMDQAERGTDSLGRWPEGCQATAGRADHNLSRHEIGNRVRTLVCLSPTAEVALQWPLGHMGTTCIS